LFRLESAFLQIVTSVARSFIFHSFRAHCRDQQLGRAWPQTKGPIPFLLRKSRPFRSASDRVQPRPGSTTPNPHPPEQSHRSRLENSVKGFSEKEFPHILRAISYNFLISTNLPGFRTGNRLPLRSHALAVTLSGFAGGEFLPLPGSKGRAFLLPAHARWVPHRFHKIAHGQQVPRKWGNSRFSDVLASAVLHSPIKEKGFRVT
jgi:hypothetical protein